MTTPRAPLIVCSWAFRYIHVALDTIVLYGVLREKNIDERGAGETLDSGSAGVSNLSSGRRRSTQRRGVRGGSRVSYDSSKPVDV